MQSQIVGNIAEPMQRNRAYRRKTICIAGISAGLERGIMRVESIIRRLAQMAVTVAMLFGFGGVVHAEEYPDLDKLCSITMTLTSSGNAVGGGEAEIYKVADLTLDPYIGYEFTLSAPFDASGIVIKPDTELDEDLSAKFAKYVAGEPLAKSAIASDGKFSFTNLKPGLYIICQTKAANGYEKFLPFLVSLPMKEDGKYIYDANGTPKIAKKTSVAKIPEPPKKEEKPAATPQPTVTEAVKDYLNTDAGRAQMIAMIACAVSMMALTVIRRKADKHAADGD